MHIHIHREIYLLETAAFMQNEWIVSDYANVIWLCSPTLSDSVVI